MSALKRTALLVALAALAFPVAAGQSTSCDGWPTEPPCYGIRPGALHHTQDATDCTTGFPLTNGTALFFTVAAHCVHRVDQSLWWFFPSPELATLDYAEMEARPPDARVVFIDPAFDAAAYRAVDDTALVELLPHAWPWFDPTLPAWGSIQGMAEAPSTGPQRIYGHGAGYHGTPAEGRVGFGAAWQSDGTFLAHIPGDVGDSGAPILDEQGRAVGFAAQQNLVDPSTPDGVLRGVTLAHALERLRAYDALWLADRVPDAAPAAEEPQPEPTEVDAPLPGPVALLGLVIVSAVLRRRA